MKYAPAATQPTLGDNEITEAPFLGGEFAVYLTEVPSIKLGTLTMSSSGNGATGISSIATWTPRPGASVIGVGGTGADLAIVAESRLISAVLCTVTFAVVDDLGASTTASASFTIPARSSNQTFSMGKGVAQDLTVGSGPTRKIASVTSITSITGGSRGVTFNVYQLPELANYTLVGSTTTKKFGTRSRQAVGIDSGMEADAFVKLGKTKKADLAIDSKFGSLMDGLARFDGGFTTALLIGIKEGVVTQNNFVYVKYVPSVEVDLPDGDGEAMANAATGKFKDLLMFEAA